MRLAGSDVDLRATWMRRIQMICDHSRIFHHIFPERYTPRSGDSSWGACMRYRAHPSPHCNFSSRHYSNVNRNK